jgi:hypothetical protein
VTAWDWAPPVACLAVWAVFFFLLGIAERWERSAKEALMIARCRAAERDALRNWLNVLGWEVSYLPDRVVIERRARDPEEERLRR